MNSLFDKQPVRELTYEERIAGGETVRALWWKQPYASAMIFGKEYETRTRGTKVRGLILICSTIRGYKVNEVVRIAGNQFSHLISCFKDMDFLPNGQAIAVGEITDSFPMKPEHEGKAIVEYHSSKWCWHFKNVRPIEPFELPGKQGWSIIDNETRNKIKFL